MAGVLCARVPSRGGSHLNRRIRTIYKLRHCKRMAALQIMRDVPQLLSLRPKQLLTALPTGHGWSRSMLPAVAFLTAALLCIGLLLSGLMSVNVLMLPESTASKPASQTSRAHRFPILVQYSNCICKTMHSYALPKLLLPHICVLH